MVQITKAPALSCTFRVASRVTVQGFIQKDDRARSTIVPGRVFQFGMAYALTWDDDSETAKCAYRTDSNGMRAVRFKLQIGTERAKLGSALYGIRTLLL